VSIKPLPNVEFEEEADVEVAPLKRTTLSKRTSSKFSVVPPPYAEPKALRV